MRDRDDDIRPGEKRVDMSAPSDATLVFVGHAETPWPSRADCPRQGDRDGPACRLVLDPVWAEALTGIESHAHLQILYWMHEARRDLVLLAPRNRSNPAGPFALRTPTRPNPIASSIVRLVERQGATLLVRGLDCVSGTPLLDIKPHRDPIEPGKRRPALTNPPGGPTVKTTMPRGAPSGG